MSIATANQTINWCPPIRRNITPSTDPSRVNLSPDFSVLITGASRGIGLATAVSYAKAGASTILITGRNTETLAAAAKEIQAAAKEGKEIKVVTFQGDVCDEEAIKRLAELVKRDSDGRLDVLILNAGKANGLVKDKDGGMDWPHDASSLDLQDFRTTFDVNFFAGVTACKYLIPFLESASPGSPKSVIWITSSSIHHYDPKLMAMGYSLSKFAAARFVEYVHEAHSAKGGVTAFGIQPGSVMTDMGRYELPEGKGWEKSEFLTCSFLCTFGLGR